MTFILQHTFAFTIGAIVGVIGVFTTCFIWGAFITYKESETDIDGFSDKGQVCDRTCK